MHSKIKIVLILSSWMSILSPIPAKSQVANMSFVPTGEFLMGTNDWEINERPIHSVFVNDFWIDKCEVTNLQYTDFLNRANAQNAIQYENNIVSKNGVDLIRLGNEYCRISFNGVFYIETNWEDYPVVEVTWYGAREYANFFSKRLPTEAEWEKAAKNGDGRLYPWGNSEPTSAICNFNGNVGGISPVGNYIPQGDSPYGCKDMSGNVFEWCADWFADNYYNSSPYDNPQGPTVGTEKVIRGGHFGSASTFIRTTSRYVNGINPELSSSDIGFRCVIDGDDSLPVSLSYFESQFANGNIILHWRTESEIDIVGFNIWRSTSVNGPFKKNNEQSIAAYGNSEQRSDYSYHDKRIENGKCYYYYIEILEMDGSSDRSKTIQATVETTILPISHLLMQNYPNPFNSGTWIPFELAVDTKVKLTIYNTIGQVVFNNELGTKKAGKYLDPGQAVHWNGSDNYGSKLPCGIYLLHLETDVNQQTIKLVLIS